MICSKCKAEFEDSLLYCPQCGQAVQIVPDYNVLDEDIIPSMLKEKEAPSNDENSISSIPKTKFSGKKGLSQSKRRYIFAFVLTLFLVIGIIAGINIYSESYSGLMKRGTSAYSSGNYNQAVAILEKASLKKKTSEVYALLGRAYAAKNDSEAAKSALEQAVSINNSDVDAYRSLLELYAKDEEMDKIASLKKTVKDEKVLLLFDDYVTDSVVFSIKAGNYDTDQQLRLTAPKGLDIYYTTDGNDPTGSYGELYSEPILLKDGTTFVAAVCKSKSGIFGQVTKQKYLISYSAPDAPLVTPDSGSYSMGNVISISTTPGTDIYYTWDNTDPTVNSSHYTEPIPMIEGNHVLSVIAYDPVHKMLSPVVRKNYVLNP